jgi:hypothetical protein
MISLLVRREEYSPNSTQGELFINGAQFCYCLEPRKDQSAGKPFCIPSGTYQVTLELSPRFGFVTPHIQDVPNFTEIEIHPGNYPHDTEGCLLVGAEKDTDFVGISLPTFNNLMRQISDIAIDESTTPSDAQGIQITYIG